MGVSTAVGDGTDGGVRGPAYWWVLWTGALRGEAIECGFEAGME